MTSRSGLVDRSAGGADAVHGQGLLVKSQRRFNVAILNRETGHSCLDRETDIGRNPFGIGSEARLVISIHRQIDGVTDKGQVLQNVVVRYPVVRSARCPCVTRTGRCQGGEAEVLKHPALPTSQGLGRTKQPCWWRPRKAASFSVTVRVIATSSMNRKGHPNGPVRFCVSLPELSILEEGARNDLLWYWCTLEQDLPRLAGKGSACIVISCANTRRSPIFRLVRLCDFRICRRQH